jgi:hypothetical protein
MQITSAGLVGIGCTPTNTLDVSRTTVGTYFTGNGGDNSARALAFTSSTTTNSGDTHTINAKSGTGIIAFAISSTEAARFGTSGNLYLGTTAASDMNTGSGAILGPSSVFGTVVSSQAISGSNVYHTGSAWKTIRTQTGYAALRYNAVSAGAFSWHSSSSAYTAGDNLPNIDGSDVKMTLEASGSLLVGTTTTGGWNGIGKVVAQTGTAAREALVVYNSAINGSAASFRVDSTTSNLQTMFYGGSVVGTITTNGTTTAYNTSSDARLKTNVSDADPASALIDAIQVRQFDWKVDNSHQRYGMIAQELLEIAPDAVHVPEDSELMMGVDYSKLVPMMIKTIQELTTRLAALEAK